MSLRRRTELLPALGLVPLVLTLLVLQAVDLYQFSQRQVGVYLEEPPDQPGLIRVTQLVPGLPAEAGGLRVGDLVRSLNGRPITDTSQMDPIMEASHGRVVYGIERGGRHLEVVIHPGARFPLFAFAVNVLVVLGYLAIGPLALLKRPGYLRARLLFLFAIAVAAEIALPEIRDTASLMLPVSLLLNGFQMGAHLHLVSVIPEKQRWLRKWPWAIPVFYCVGLLSFGFVAVAYLLEHFHRSPLPWAGDRIFEWLTWVVFPLWVVSVLALLARQARAYPEAKGRQQAGWLAIGLLPWGILVVLSVTRLLDRWVPMYWQDVTWNALLLFFPVAVFYLLAREARSQEQILLSLTDEVQRVSSIGDVSRVVSTDLHEAFHPKSTHVFYRQRHSRDLTLGHSTGVAPREEQIPEQSMLLRLVEAYGKAVDYPEDLAGLPPDEQAWLDRLAARLIVPLIGRDHRLLGLLVLGEKKSEEPYTPHDRALLQALSNQIALVYENARLKDRVEQSQKVQREVLARLGEQELQLVHECPLCGRCYDASEKLCPEDGAELTPSLPVERVIMGRYRLDRKLERGGMGAIFAARDLHLGRQVAVKVLHGALLGEEATRRFEVEARLTASLHHPNIVTVYDYGTTGTGNSFLVMELLAGTTLLAAIRDGGALDPVRVAGWLDQVCEGVKAAHRAGIIHRDLKPANIFITRLDTTEDAAAGAAADRRDGPVKILDFGVAKVRSTALQATAGLTAPGALVGTFSYMAPEQLIGGEVDERSDVFALGVLAVESLTGDRPFPGSDPGEILHAIGAGSFRLNGAFAGADRLQAALQRCLARDPEARFPTVAALQAELIPALRELTAPAAAGPPGG
ncbi:MAG TPA: protein kinase [Thermoanaerobaculia bacterium]|nr:protein kinase [Thermoanaerobaculia bacterium]